jgi:competence protein ComEA
LQRPEPTAFLRRSGQLLAGVLLGLLAGGIYFVLSAEPRGEPVQLLGPESMRVHVAGAVARPEVYSLPSGSIVRDAIDAAGGPTADADLSRLNLAQPVGDGQRIEVPTRSQSAALGTGYSLAGPSARLPLNSASAAELELLPGIGPALAQNIVEYRDRHGPFQRIEDLLEVDGIGPAKLEGIRDLLSVP